MNPFQCRLNLESLDGRCLPSVSPLAPGVIETARIVQLMGARARENEVNPEIALRRNGRPEDCAKVVEFLCTDLSDYVSGALIPIDGGWNRAG